MEIIQSQWSLKDLQEMAEERGSDLVKAVVDVQREIIALDAELHADLESLLLEDGSRQEDLWGINLYPSLWGQDDFIEFDAMINVRPTQNNRSRGVEDPTLREKIRAVVSNRIPG